MRTRFMKDISAANAMKVPLGALDERGDGVRIWQLHDNKALPISAQIIALDNEYAWVIADLPESSYIITLGTNQLKPGMAVQSLNQ